MRWNEPSGVNGMKDRREGEKGEAKPNPPTFS
jgi:hypothetical protein